MSRIDSSTAADSSASSTPPGNSVKDLDLDVFLNLMLTQLQNQDPINPMENDELLNTISQIREISANDKLSDTLGTVLLGQNVATATGLIGTEVEGLTDEGRRVVGKVQQVTINDGAPRLELAVATSAKASDKQGAIAPGNYAYEVVWKNEEGQALSVQLPVNTEDLGEEFQGAIRIENLPETKSGVKRSIYRTDGTGDPRLVGTIDSSNVDTFTDTLPTEKLSNETLTGQRTVLPYADVSEVRLSQISNVKTIQ